MNYRVLGRILGLALVTEAVLMVPSMLIGLYHGESILGFSTAIGILLIVGMLLLSFKPKDNSIFAREGFLGVSLSWILLSMFGALPFTIEKMIPDYVSAVFEVASGFTTTGASVLTAVEGCPYGLLFWRSFTNWVGGMGVLVFIMAVLPLADDRSMHIMRAEVPGPVVGKLVPKARQSAMILYSIYVAISALEVVFLLAGGMPLYDAMVPAAVFGKLQFILFHTAEKYKAHIQKRGAALVFGHSRRKRDSSGGKYTQYVSHSGGDNTQGAVPGGEHSLYRGLFHS